MDGMPPDVAASIAAELPDARPALSADEVDWTDPETLRGALVETREAERDATTTALFSLVAIRWLLARKPLSPSSPAAERIVIRAVATRAAGRGVFRGVTVESFTCPCRRALWLYLTARIRLPAWQRPAAWELQDELETCELAGDVTADETRAAVAEVVADEARREAIHAARSAASALERRLDEAAGDELRKATVALSEVA